MCAKNSSGKKLCVPFDYGIEGINSNEKYRKYLTADGKNYKTVRWSTDWYKFTHIDGLPDDVPEELNCSIADFH